MHSILLSIVASPATTGQMGKSVSPVWKLRGVQVHWGRMGNHIAPNMVVNVSAIEKDTGAVTGKVIISYGW
jgi:hypothetical protein